MLPSQDGLLLLDKPVGPTSHDMVSAARRALGVRRIGHTGTLDPFASGLLLLCVGRATRLAEYLHDLPKEYEADAVLGVATTTDDPEGEVAGESGGWESLTEEGIRTRMEDFVGDLEQTPPVYSAKKVQGMPAHRRMRRGESVTLDPVTVRIHRFELLDWNPPRLRFRVVCSTGTYVRALARDLAVALGTLGHLAELRRTRIGLFQVTNALLPDQLGDPELVTAALVPPLHALAHLPSVRVSDEEGLLLTGGRAIEKHGGEGEMKEETPVAVALGSHLLAVAERRGAFLHPKKVFPLE